MTQTTSKDQNEPISAEMLNTHPVAGDHLIRIRAPQDITTLFVPMKSAESLVTYLNAFDPEKPQYDPEVVQRLIEWAIKDVEQPQTPLQWRCVLLNRDAIIAKLENTTKGKP